MKANTNMPFENYREQVFEKLKKYANFKSPDKEALEYMASDEVAEAIEKDYKNDRSVEECAWGIDILY